MRRLWRYAAPALLPAAAFALGACGPQADRAQLAEQSAFPPEPADAPLTDETLVNPTPDVDPEPTPLPRPGEPLKGEVAAPPEVWIQEDKNSG